MENRKKRNRKNNLPLMKRLVFAAYNNKKELLSKMKPFVLTAMLIISNVTANKYIQKQKDKKTEKTEQRVASTQESTVRDVVSGSKVFASDDLVEIIRNAKNICFGELEFDAEELNRAKGVQSDMMDNLHRGYLRNMRDNKPGHCLGLFKFAANSAEKTALKNKQSHAVIFDGFSAEDKEAFDWTIGSAYEAKDYLEKMNFVSYKRKAGTEEEISETPEIRHFQKGRTEHGHIEFAYKKAVYYDNKVHWNTPNKPYGDLTCYTAENVLREVVIRDIVQNSEKYAGFLQSDGSYLVCQTDKIPEEKQDLYAIFTEEEKMKETYYSLLRPRREWAVTEKSANLAENLVDRNVVKKNPPQVLINRGGRL